MALCYNFTRVLSILGLDRFLAYLARSYPNWANLLLKIILVVAGQVTVARPNNQIA